MLSAKPAFSLIELVIALSILAVGLVGAMRIFPVGLRASQRTEMSSRATLMAHKHLESLKLTAWDDLAPGEAEDDQDSFHLTTRIDSVQPEPLSDGSRLKSIEVTVDWQQEGKVRQLSFITYVRRPNS